MGLQDRDYYKDAHKAREAGDIHRYHTGRSFIRRFASPSRLSLTAQLVLFCVLCVVVVVVLKLISRLYS